MPLPYFNDEELDYIEHLVEEDDPVEEMKELRRDVLRTIKEEKD